MSKILAISCCLLGFAIACVPAFASPTNKKITVACSSVAPNDITCSADTVALCASAPVPCKGQTFPCPDMLCDSSGASAPPSTTISCTAPFKAVAIEFNVSWAEAGATPPGIGFFTQNSLNKGKVGFSLTTGPTSPATDSVTFTIK